MSPLEQIEFWHWWIAGVALVIIEVFAPGAIFMWMGISAGIVGAMLLAVPDISWQVQFLVFAVLSVGSIAGWRVYHKRNPTESDQPSLNRRGEQYVGRVFTLQDGITNGTGVVRVDDSRWKIEGEDLPAGTKVRVTGVEGTVLKVEREAAAVQG
ncbi:MAG: NfeD family protein [Kiloniellales bacterium]|nr:NfeD family protein [Kiloniellales bacterium]